MQNAVAGHSDSEMVIFHFLAMLELEHIGAENINLVTPTPHVNGICRALDLAKGE